MKLILTIELVPKTCFYSNVRSMVSPSEWDRLRNDCYKKANNVCEICGGHGDRWPVECHEIWLYDDKNKIQKLEKLIALCPSCHHVKHWGLSRLNNLEDDCMDHFTKVNKCSDGECLEYVEKSFRQWRERSQHYWSADLRVLEKYGVKEILNDRGY